VLRKFGIESEEYIYFTKFGIAAQCLNPDSRKYHEKTIEEAGP